MALKNLLVKIGVQTKGLNSDLRKAKGTFRRNFGEIQSLVSNVGRTMTASLTAPLGIMAVQSVRAFNTQQKAIAQVEAGLKSTAGQVGYTSKQLQQMASDLQNKTLFGDEEILANATAQLLTFTNISGEQFSRVQGAALDLATRLDGDLKSASIQLGKALNDPIANLSALSRSGIQFSDDQKAVIKTMAETGRLAEAQTLILDELEKQYGGSAEAAAQAGTGGLKQFQNSLGDLQEQFGAIIFEVMTPLIKQASKVVSAFQSLSLTTKKNILIVAGLLGAAGPIAMAVAALMPIMGALVGPVGLVAAAVGALAYLIIDNFSVIEPAIVSVVNAVITFQNKTKALGLIFNVVKSTIMAVVRSIQTAFLNTIDLIGGLGRAAVAVFEGDFSKAADIMGDTFTEMGERSADAALDIGEDFMEGFNSAMNTEDIELLQPDTISRFARQIKTDISAALSQGGTGAVDVPIRPKMQTMAARPAAAAGTAALMMPEGGYGQATADLTAMNREMAVTFDLTNAVSGAFMTLGEAIAGIATGTSSIGQFLTQMLQQFGDLLGQIGAQMISAGVAASTFMKTLLLNPGAAIAAGVAMVAAGGIISGLANRMNQEPPALAEGGLAFGKTLATVGDNPNAGIDPEVIAPLSKLRDMMGGSNVVVTGRLDGRDLLISSERANFDRNRVRGF
jgi:hypothetical protein